MQDKAEDAARLTPCKDDNAVLRKLDRKDCLLFIRYYSTEQNFIQIINGLLQMSKIYNSPFP